MTDTSMVDTDSSDNNITGEDSRPSWGEAVSQPSTRQNAPANKQQNLPTWDDALKKNEPSALGTTARAVGSMAADSLSLGHYDSSPAVDEFMQHTSVGRILSDFGHGFSAGTSGYQNLGIEPGGETEKALQKYGLMNDYINGESSFRKAITGGIMTTAAATMDAFIRTDIGLGISGPIGAVGGVVNETGLTGVKYSPEAMKEESEAMTETVLSSPFLAEFHLPKPSFTRKDYKQAKSVGVMDGEDVYMGLKEPTPEQETAQRAAAIEVAPLEPIEEESQPDIHQIARDIAPDTFDEYDRLSVSKEGLRSSLSYLNDQRQLDAETNAPHTAEIEELENKLNEANPRKAKIYQAKIDELTEANRASIEEAKSTDTNEMAQIRQRLQELDYRMRDLAPDVSAAYRSAKEQLPEAKIVEETTKAENPNYEVLNDALVQSGNMPVTRDGAIHLSQFTDAEKAELERLGLIEDFKTDEGVAYKGINDEKLRALRDQAKEAGKLKYASGVDRAAAAKGHRSLAAKKRASGDVEGAERHEAKAAEFEKQDKEVNQNTPKTTFKTSKGSSYEVQDDGTTIRNKSYHPEHGEKDKGIQPKSEDTFYLPIDEAQKLSIMQAKGGAKMAIAKDGDHYAIKYADGTNAGKIIKDTVVKTEAKPKIGLIPVEIWNKGERVHFGNEITEVNEKSELKSTELNHSSEEQHAAIVSDVTKKLTDLGRPLEEAQASAEIVGRFFRTMSEIYGGTKGTAEDWYAKEGPTIKAGKERVKVLAQEVGKGRELNQAARGKIRLAADDAKATITLFKTANASTFMHESAHNFLDIMTRYAKEDDAPERLKKDVETINKYLGVGEDGTIKTSQHEKFARSFERYLMEGVAPSKELAGVFQKFKKWLTDIYKTVEQLRAPITNDIRDVFNRLLTNETEEPIIASERQTENKTVGNGLFEGTKLENFSNRLSKIFSGIHKIDADRTPPEKSAEAADKIEAEIDEISKNHDKETYDVISKPEVTEVSAEASSSEPSSQSPEPAAGTESSASRSATVPASGSDIAAESAKPREPESAVAGTTGGASDASTEESSSGTRSSRSDEENPNQKFGRGESNLVDKAGNIRLDNLSTPEDVNQVIRETAQDNDNFMQARRGVIPAGEQLNLADALGMQPHDLDFRKIGQAFNAEQIIAARKLLIKSATELKNAMSKAATGTDADVIAYAEAKARHQMIQEQVAGITAEAGRALGAFRKLAGDAEAKQIGEFIETSEGKPVGTKDLFQRLRQEAELGSKLETPQQLSKFINDSKKATIRDMVLEYYINALISGPITHLRYSVGNALNALWTPLVEIPIAAAIGAIRGTSDRVYLGEAGAQLHGLLKGSRDGINAAITAFKTGNSPFLPGERASTNFSDIIKINAIPGVAGRALNIPSKSVSAIHSFFKSIRYEQNIQALAYRTAMKEGLSEGTDSFTNRVTDLSVNPTEDMMHEATAHSLKELYMSPTEYNSTMGALNRAINSNLLAKIIVPFMKIGSQITRNAFIERTLLGILDKDVRGNLLSGSAAGDYQAAKIATGVALMGTMALMTAEGMCTGDGPSDPSKRAIWLLNHTPNSCQVGGLTLRYQGLGHLGMLARFSANMTETAQSWDASDGDKLAHSFFSLIEGGTKSVLDENFMRGVKDMLDAVYHPEEYGAQYVRSFATNWLPFSVGSSQTARQVDPYQRQISKNEGFIQQIFDTARSKIPFASESLQPRRDRFGEPIPNGGPLPSYANDPVVQRMEQLQIGVGQLSQKIRGVPLNGQQFDDYSRLAGRMSKMQLNQIVANPGFKNLPQGIQIETIRKIIESSRSTAASIVMMQSVGSENDIIKKAKNAKIEAATSGKHH